MDEQETRNTLACGSNAGALRVISKRVEESVARAILVDLHREGIITIGKRHWDTADGVVQAMKRVIDQCRDDY